MGLLWWIVAIVVAFAVVLSAIDIFRRRLSAGATIGWLVLIVVLPLIGSIIYWAVRKPSAEEVEHAYEAQADMRRDAPMR
jgi:hypothetical protein